MDYSFHPSLGAKYYFDGRLLIDRTRIRRWTARGSSIILYFRPLRVSARPPTSQPTNQALTVKEKHRRIAKAAGRPPFFRAKQEKMEWKTTTFPIIVERRPLFIDRSRCPRTWLHSANTTTVSTPHHHHLSKLQRILGHQWFKYNGIRSFIRARTIDTALYNFCQDSTFWGIVETDSNVPSIRIISKQIYTRI